MLAKTSPEIGGMGHPIKRKEDLRFIQGKGNYIDDVVLPGMVYGHMVRSPYAHARITAIRTEEAKKLPGVLAVITGEDLAKANLAWMPTLFHDKQMVLATGKVLFQSQEVAFVVAEDRYTAADAAELVEVDYEELPVLVDPHKAQDADAPILRDDREEKSNLIFHWEVGDRAATQEQMKSAPVTALVKAFFPRCHPAPLETCGCVIDFNSATGKLTAWITSQAPHAHRTVFALVAGLPEQNIRVISPDIGGGFGNKVPVYPGYVCAAVAALTIGRPVKWIETRSENLQSTGFARDYHMEAELAADKDGRVKALRVKTLADHGAFNAAAQPTKFPAGLYSICTGSYDFSQAFCEVDGVYTNKAPGGIAYRCSFRVTEAAYLIERAMDVLAQELKLDPAELRRRNFIPPEKFPYLSPLGWNYDSGNYQGALDLALEKVGYNELRKEQAEKRKQGQLMGIGLSSFTEIVGAGPSHTFDILGLKMFDSAELRVHPTGKAIMRMGTKSQGQGHETTYAQIVAQELGIPAADVVIEEGDTDTAPYGLGTYASRSTPTSGAAAALAARKVREKARKLAAHLLEVSEEDLEWEPGKFSVKGAPGKSKTIQEIAFAAYTNFPEGMEPGLEAVNYYDPPNLTFPFGTYVAVVDIDKGTGQVKVRRFVAVDDCGNIINPMIVEGQVHGGLTEGLAIAFMQEISYDESGNVQGGTFMDYLVPTAVETPRWETGHTCTPSPHHPFGAKGVGESPNVGSPAAFVNAVVDALSHLGVKHIDMPLSPWKIWQILKEKGVTQ
ncbi:MAG: carbon-monoxide dehydrogenase large subunit [Verrucomicrobia bacterium]|nr:carbon-monoxide dehydrogenase large subunit [Verrucomicrobiota bacterium]MBV8483989.1 carbon-monoxide dehydrogenase large subunit [Verrucomicrobiota bacterium]